MSTQAQSVFRNRNFSLFYAGQAFSYVGDGLRFIAVPLLVYHLTGSALSTGITYALEIGPFALFGLIGGSLADRIDRKRMMIACDAVRFAILTYFALGYAFGFLTLTGLYLGIATISIAAAIFMGGQASTIPYLLGQERATRAVSTLFATEQATQMVVPPIGGALFAVIGPLPALAINAVTYLISQFSLASVDSFGPDEPGPMPSPRKVMRDIGFGFRFAFADRTMRTIAIYSLFLNLFGMMTGAVYIAFLKRDLGATDLGVGLAYGVGAIGAVVGSYFAGRMPKAWTFGNMIVVAYIFDGVLFIPTMFAHDIAIVMISMALTNACVMFEIAQIVGWRMRVTPPEMVGRVFGAVRLIALAGTVPGSIVGGLVADTHGPRTSIIISGCGYIALALAAAATPAIRRERR
jgi:MFS family permease